MPMKRKLLLMALVLVLFSIGSCRKEFSIDQPTTGTPSTTAKGLMVRIQQGTDPDLSKDTVHLLQYDNQNRLVSIIDSSYKDTITGTYNSLGQLVNVLERNDSGYGYANYTYSSSGQLSGIDASNGDRYTFGYTNGILANSALYSNSGPGTPVLLYRRYTYSVSGGNVTDIKEFQPDGTTLLSDSKFTYGSQPNIFKSILLYNYSNELGFSYLYNFEMFFSTYLPAKELYADSSFSYTQTYAYTNNSLQKLGSLKSEINIDPSAQGTYLPINLSLFFIYK